MTDVTVEDYSYYTSRELARALPMYRLTGAQYDVWYTMLGAMQRGGWVELTLADIANRLGMYESNVSTDLSKLRAHGLLWRQSDGLYRINPRVAFRGTVDEWNEALESIPAEVPEVLIPDYKRRPPRARKRADIRAA